MKYVINNSTDSITSKTGISRTLSIYDNGQKGIVDNPTNELIDCVKEAIINNSNLSFETITNGGYIARLTIDNKRIIP